MVRALPMVAVCLSLLFASGCGESETPRYNFSGTVTFEGKPLPYGRIQFVPDAEQNNEGGSGFAEVIDGKFDTGNVGSRGVIGGPHKIRIRGYASVPVEGNDDEVATSDLPVNENYFMGFEMPESYDFPTESYAKGYEIVVPDSARGFDINEVGNAPSNNGGA
ncbi:MAG: hypothetical protein R3C01_00405 [Planctomycetaceae bacterium]